MNDALLLNLGSLISTLFALLLLFLIADAALRAAVRAVRLVPALSRLEGIAALQGGVRTLLLATLLMASLGVTGVAAWMMISDMIIPYVVWDAIRHISPDVWGRVALIFGEGVLILVALAVVRRLTHGIVQAAAKAADDWEELQTNDLALEAFFRSFERDAQRVLMLAAITLTAWITGAPNFVLDTCMLGLRMYAILGVGLAVWKAIDAGLETVLAFAQKVADEQGVGRWYEHMLPLLPLFRRAVELAIYLGVATLAMHQIEAVAFLGGWGVQLLKVLALVFLGRVAVEVLALGVEEVLITRATLDAHQLQRRQTMLPLLKGMVRYTTYFGIGILICNALNVDPTPFLAGAGIVGLAISLGAQKVINDVVSGFLILFENYFLIGDYVDFGEAKGWVERISFRTTTLRDRSGRVHIVRNGDISHIVNYSKEWTFAVVDVGLDYGHNLKEGLALLRTLDATLGELDAVLEPMKLHVESFEEERVVVRMRIKVKPGTHADVAAAARLMTKDLLDEANLGLQHVKRMLLIEELTGSPRLPGQGSSDKG